MTAINCFIKRDVAWIMTDTAWYNPYGIVQAFELKTFQIGGMTAALACRGPGGLGQRFVEKLAGMHRTFDRLCANAESDFWRIHETLGDLSQYAGFLQYELFVVGWHEKANMPMGFHFSPFEKEGPTFEPIKGISFEPFADFIGAGVDVSRFTPEREGVQIMECQRQEPTIVAWLEEEDKLFIVGGQVSLTEIRRGSVRQSIVHDWGDHVGELIDPSRSSVNLAAGQDEPRDFSTIMPANKIPA